MQDHRNLSGTPPSELGGLAVFDGVMMRSRTGFAIATRNPEGTVAVLQVPFRAWRRANATRWRSIPFLRGLASLYELFTIGTRAMEYTARKDQDATRPLAPPDRRSVLLLTVSLALFTVLFLFLPAVLSGWLFPGAGALTASLMESVFRVTIVILYILMLSLDGEIRRVFQYHGAEHQAASAFERRRDVTVSLAAGQDVLHPRCGTTLIATVVLLSIPVYAVLAAILDQTLWMYEPLEQRVISLAAHLVILPILIAGAFELIRRAAPRRASRWARLLLLPGLQLQRLTTRTPNDGQREVAIIAMYAAMAISHADNKIRRYRVRGLEDDESAPGFTERSPARPAPIANRSAEEDICRDEQTHRASGKPSRET